MTALPKVMAKQTIMWAYDGMVHWHILVSLNGQDNWIIQELVRAMDLKKKTLASTSHIETFYIYTS